MAATKKPVKYDTWMPLYISDYLVKTTHLTAEQHGAYLLLLMTAWKADGRLVNDHQELQQIARLSSAQWQRNVPILQRFFKVTPEFWINERLVEELDKAKLMVAKKSSAGKTGAAQRWGIGNEPEN